MPGLENTIARLARFRHAFGRMEDGLGTTQPPVQSRLREILGFGANPGALRMHIHVPTELPPKPALVVALHGCTQNAAVFEHGTGWSDLADRHGFVVVYPEQQAPNNAHLCFNWFLPADTARDCGEAHSIREMIAHATRTHGIDGRRVYVTGLSAGGAMTSAMLAAYPEVFAGGAIVAGLPSGAASNLQQALERMAQGHAPALSTLGDRVRAASAHAGPWPKISIWHGGADTVVVPANAEATLAQWLDVHGLTSQPPREQVLAGLPRRVWSNGAGEPVIEAITIPAMGHGVPLAISGKPAPTGNAAPFFIDAGISAVDHSARFFGLIDAEAPARATHAPRPPKPAAPMAAGPAASLIEAALKAAGLPRRR